MNFSTDRDLLVIEPSLFTDVPILSQQRCRITDGQVSGTTLTSAAADFESAQIEAGNVILINTQPHEVIARIDPHTLTISLPRTRITDAPIPSTDGTGLHVTARTFAPQAALMNSLLLRLLGIEPDDPDCHLTEDSIVSLTVMSRLEALGTLERIYTAAAAITGDNENLLQKAALYRRLFSSALQRAVILIDSDGDGYADVRKQLGVVKLTRV